MKLPLCDGVTLRSCREPLGADGIRTKVSLRNRSAGPVAVDEVEVLRLGLNGPGDYFAGEKAIRFLRFDFRMPGMTANFGVLGQTGINHAQKHERDDSWLFEEAAAWKIRSDPLLVLASLDRRKMLLVGAGTFRRAESEIWLSCDKQSGELSLSFTQRLDGLELSPGAEIELEEIVQLTQADLNESLKRWADYTAAGSKPPPRILKKIPVGWSDWQFYLLDKTQDIVLKNAVALAELKAAGWPFEYVVIDNGFCANLTEWETPSASFPDGIAALSKKIGDLGLKTGLWLAPYTQNTASKVVREHPEWLVRDEAGNLVVAKWSNVGEAHLLDYSIPEVEEWLRYHIRLMVRDWNIKWIKIDGPRYSWYRQGVLKNRKTMSITEMFSRTLEIMRAAAGPDVILEGEGPLGAALGKANLHRVQGDNFSVWYHENNACKPRAPKTYSKELIMSFLHNRWWINHRQDVILRDFPSPHRRETKDPVFSETELNTELTSAVFASGGLLFCDPVDAVRQRPRMKKLLDQLFPVQPEACEIVDAFPDERWPAIFRQPRPGGFALAVVNWGDQPRTFTIAPNLLPPSGAGYRGYTFFGEEDFAVEKGALVITLPARGSAIIEKMATI